MSLQPPLQLICSHRQTDKHMAVVPITIYSLMVFLDLCTCSPSVFASEYLTDGERESSPGSVRAEITLFSAQSCAG